MAKQDNVHVLPRAAPQRITPEGIEITTDAISLALDMEAARKLLGAQLASYPSPEPYTARTLRQMRSMRKIA